MSDTGGNNESALGLLRRLNKSAATLVARLREGDVSVVPELVELFIPLATVKAAKFGWTPWMRDELYSTALVELYRGILKAATQLKDDNLAYYLAARLTRNLTKAAYKLKHPTESWDTAHAKDGRVNWSMARHELDTDKHCLKFTEREEALYATILSLCKNATEVRVVELLTQYYTYVEIGEMLGLSKPRIGQIKLAIEERYRDYVRNETSEAVRDNADALLRKERPPVVGGAIHAEGETGSAAESILAQY